MKVTYPGLFLCMIIACLAKILSFSLPQVGSVSLAIILGILVTNICNPNKRCNEGINYAERVFLPIAIVLMGAKLRLDGIQELGVSPLYTVLPPMLIAIGSSLLIGRILKLSPRASLLLGVGNSVCGASAAVSAASVLKPSKEELALTISSVNLMGTIGLFIVPALAHLLYLTEDHSAFLIGGSLQAVGQVVAAGHSMSDLIGEQAVLLKMLRVAMIGPIVLILSILFCPECGIRKGLKIPSYIIGFICLAFVSCFLPPESLVIRFANQFSNYFMLIAMAGIGLNIKARGLFAQGTKTFIMVACLSIVQVGSLFFFMQFYR